MQDCGEDIKINTKVVAVIVTLIVLKRNKIDGIEQAEIKQNFSNLDIQRIYF